MPNHSDTDISGPQTGNNGELPWHDELMTDLLPNWSSYMLNHQLWFSFLLQGIDDKCFYQAHFI
jgi:hypothetical protein